MNKKQPSQTLTNKQYEDLGRILEEVYLTGYAKPKRLFFMSVIKGIAYGFGIFIGGTIVVALMIWMLSKFNQVPILNPFVEKITEIVNSTNKL